MNVTPKTENELRAAGLLPNDWYPFEIVEATDTKSKAGNDMIALNVRVYRETGGHTFIPDWLLDSNPISAAKLRHCAVACDLTADYEHGTLPAELFVNRQGWAKVIIQKSKDEQYSDKNAIVDYAKEKPQPKGKGTKAAATDEAEDDIPWKV